VSNAIIPEALLLSVTGAIATTNAVDFMPSLYRLVAGEMVSSSQQWLLKDISIINTHASVHTAVSVLADSEAKWLMTAPANSGSQKEFSPPLPLGEHKKVALKCSAAGTVQVAARFLPGRV
jgi:hypothetical protein